MSRTPARGDRVLITGASSFIGLHIIAKLLEAGFVVRGTIRSTAKEAEIRAAVGGDPAALGFCVADLSSDAGWAEAVDGCPWIIHCASPFPAAAPKHEDELIIPARDGTLRVLKAAAAAKASRVVLTSSLAAVLGGHERDPEVYTERDWSELPRMKDAYAKSKTMAEKAAWGFLESLPPGDRFELVAVCPGLVLGPARSAGTSASLEVVGKLVRREVPGCPDLSFPCVDVRDVADMHVMALTTPAAAGQRFLCSAVHGSMIEIAEALQKHLGPRGYKIPTRKIPSFAVQLIALFDPAVRLVKNDLGRRYRISIEHGDKVLGWRPKYGLEAMVTASADSLVAAGSKS